MEQNWHFTDNEIRVLGALMEKQMTTPEYYPMTPNALRNACNQKSNRDPVVAFDDATVIATLDKLRGRQLIYIVSTHGSRTRKYEHRLKDALHLSRKELALMSVLMLRGFQTIGELRGRTERMVQFESLEEVEETLHDLMRLDRQPLQLVRRLERMPGQKDHRYAQLLAGEITQEQIDQSAQSVTVRVSNSAKLEARIEVLEEQVKKLTETLEQFKKQFE